MIWISGRPGGHAEGELPAPDGALIPYRAWERPDALAAVCYLHGQGDHSGPFTAMGDHLHSAGLAVYAHDHRGFGRSRERRGHIDSYERYIADTLAVVGNARTRNPGRPVFLLGLSMGGHLALRVAARPAAGVAGVVALSPGFKLRHTPKPMVARTLFYLLVDPDKPLPTVTRLAPTTRNQVHLERSGQDEHWVSSFTARFYLETLRSVRQAYWDMARVRVPALVLMAGQDGLVCPRTARRYFERIGSADKEFRVLPGLYHNLVAEPEMPLVAGQVSQWIDRRSRPDVAAVPVDRVARRP